MISDMISDLARTRAASVNNSIGQEVTLLRTGIERL